MPPREKAKHLLMQHLPSAGEEDCGEIVDQIIAAVKQDVVELILERLETGAMADFAADLTEDMEQQKAYEAFYANWEKRFSQRKMTEDEFAKTFGEKNSARLNGALLEMILKGAEIG